MKPFQDITVIEFSTMITASFATMMMAEQGARVIKVEPIELGDPMRGLGTSKAGISALFANCNRGKESIRIDLKSDEGHKIVRDLIAGADIVIHNFRPGVMDQLNLGSDQLRSLDPRLIYMAISGFSSEGPLSGAPAYDPIIQAHAGLTAAQGADSPAFVRNLICDKVTAYTACQAVTGALLVRERSGAGQHIDLSMLDSGLFFIFPDGFMNNTLLDDDGINQLPALADLIYELTPTKDGSVTISAATDAQRAAVVIALGKEELLADPRFSSLPKLLENMDTFMGILQAAFKEFTTDEILARMQEYDVPCAKCLDHEEVINQAQIEANGTIEVREHPLMGTMRVVRSPAKFYGRSLEPTGHSPAHGEHTESVLAELGIRPAELEELQSRGVIG
ncbi:MAG: CoA transferase [Halieaceae bacterium]|jgi:crotonobetainyl-CoA:carnitine CoA-transferase CaiB-like acyl-CoA transferase|nr:CoA transferase [Halieaceae bacterium]